MSGGATARDEVLARIRGALGAGVVAPEVPRAYRRAGTTGETGSPEVVDRFCERVAEYRASVTRIAPEALADTIARLCRERGARRIAVPPGGPEALDGVEVVADDPPLSPQALDQLDGVLTGCALAIAETGTIVLDGGERSGRRALTLVPDWHICIVEESSIVAGVPDAVAALAGAERFVDRLERVGAVDEAVHRPAGRLLELRERDVERPVAGRADVGVRDQQRELAWAGGGAAADLVEQQRRGRRLVRHHQHARGVHGLAADFTPGRRPRRGCAGRGRPRPG